MTHPEELVILLDDAGHEIGTAPKSEVHTTQTPLHRAFSCYLTDGEGNLLLSRRALSKLTWPGVWTNSFCGHPSPGESDAAAIQRRAREELGATVSSVEVVVPDFRYRAVDASGVVENEICPVYTAVLTSPLDPDPDEVSEWTWVRASGLGAALDAAPAVFSPWMQLQFPALQDAGVFLEGVDR